jgi:hypothetical protein
VARNPSTSGLILMCTMALAGESWALVTAWLPLGEAVSRDVRAANGQAAFAKFLDILKVGDGPIAVKRNNLASVNIFLHRAGQTVVPRMEIGATAVARPN